MALRHTNSSSCTSSNVSIAWERGSGGRVEGTQGGRERVEGWSEGREGGRKGESGGWE